MAELHATAVHSSAYLQHASAYLQHGWIVCLTLASTLLVNLSTASAQGLFLDSQRGKVGDTVTFTIHIDNAPNPVQALGFAVTYDPQVLHYVGAQTSGELTGGFEFFQTSAPVPGQIRVGGFATKPAIAAGASGRLVTLAFQVLQPDHATLSFVRPVDHIAQWTTHAGLFEPISQPSQDQPPAAVTTAPSGFLPAASGPSPAHSAVGSVPMPSAGPPLEPPAVPQPRSLETPAPVSHPAPGHTAQTPPTTVQDTHAASQQHPGAKPSGSASTPATSVPTHALDHASQTGSTTTQGIPREYAQTLSPAGRHPGENIIPTARTAQHTSRSPIENEPAPASELWSQRLRLAVPVAAIVILGAIIVVLGSMKGPE